MRSGTSLLALLLCLLVVLATVSWADQPDSIHLDRDSKEGRQTSDRSVDNDKDKNDESKVDAAKSRLPQKWRRCRLIQKSQKPEPRKPDDETASSSSPSSGSLDCRGLGLLTVPSGPPPSGVTTLRLGGNLFRELTDVRLPGIRRLELDRCQIGRLRAYALAGATDVERLDLSSNNIVSLPTGLFSRAANLRYLQLAQNRLTRLPDLPCGRLARLRTLNLASNKIAELLVPSDYALCPALDALILSGNRQISALLVRHLAPLSRPPGRLRELRLAGCPISRLEPGALPRSLAHLDLSGSRLAPNLLLSRLAADLAGLHWLRLHRVDLAIQLRPAQLAQGGLSALRSLHITCANPHNKPLELPERATFTRGTRHLQHLQLDACGFATFDYQVSSLANLHTLELSENRLYGVPAGLPSSLQRLSLRNNQIASLSDAALLGLEQLRRLDLRGNHLAAAAGAFDFVCRAPALAELDMDEAGLRTFELHGRFDGAPPPYPIDQAMRLRGGKRKKALRAYAKQLLELTQIRCFADPLPRLPAPKGRDWMPENSAPAEESASISSTGSSPWVIAFVIALVVCCAVAIAFIYVKCFRGTRRYRGFNQANGAAPSAAAQRAHRSQEHLVTNSHANRNYDGSASIPLVPFSPREQAAPVGEQLEARSDSYELPDGDQGFDAEAADAVAAAEEQRLDRAEGGGVCRSPSQCSLQPVALLIGLKAEIEKLLDSQLQISATLITLDESIDSLPDESNSVDRIFVLLNEALLLEKSLTHLLSALLRSPEARKKTKIVCLFEKDTPELLSEMERTCPNLHRIYTRYRQRLIAWHLTERSLKTLETHL